MNLIFEIPAQFGAWENGAKPQHGFARNKRWTIVTKTEVINKNELNFRLKNL
jgi:D-hexose-6-phosphate mutarotase